MPANLNALIRYRTIDQCLSNPYRKWTITDLAEACASALKEHRGIYSGISERTIREDIRVMRSDILGFNAPIVQSGGHYSYGDRDYSIFNVSIQEAGLLERVLEFMLEIRSEVKHKDMDKIIERISEALPEIRSARETGPEYDDLKSLSSFMSEPGPQGDSLDFGESQETDEAIFQQEKFMKEPDAPDKLQWSLILTLI
jgi:hypothetical protein